MMNTDQKQVGRAFSSRGGYDPGWFDLLAEVEERHFWFRARNGVIATVAAELAREIGPNLRLLEAGCGNGNVLRALRKSCPKGRLVGLDLFHEGLQHARRRCDCELVSGDILNPPFAPGSFDLVGMFDVLEHLPDDREALRVVHSLVAPGGTVFLTVPACPALWSYFDEIGGHYRRYGLSDLTDKLTETGFRVTYASYFITTVFPLVWARRWWTKNRHRAGDNDAVYFKRAADELKVRPLVNELLLRLMSWERWWIGRQMTLPIGSSLLAVARKPVATQ
jgi:SAM-dependent methyltransferase